MYITSFNGQTAWYFTASDWCRARLIGLWAIASLICITSIAAYLHFAFELSGFWKPVAFISSVNESTWEHLKMFFWATVIFSLVEYTYIQHQANNYWFAKAIGMLTTLVVICVTFYGYLTYAIPIYGRGFLAIDISTGIVGVIAGQIVCFNFLRAAPQRRNSNLAGAAVLVVLLAMFSTFTYFPPKFFLFEHYYHNVYSGEFGILDDYSRYLVFK